MKLKFLIAFVALVPGIAQAKPHSASAHMRPQLFHDRSPKPHSRDARPHEMKVPSPKSSPPPAAKAEA